MQRGGVASQSWVILGYPEKSPPELAGFLRKEQTGEASL